MRYRFKIIASVVLISMLMLSISIFAFADPLSLAIGGAMSAYAEAAGVSIASSGLTPNSFNSYWHQSTGLGDDWLDPLSDYRVYYHRDTSTNTVDIYTDGAIIPAGKGGVDTWISNNSIVSNSSGSIYNNVVTFEGYAFTRPGNYPSTLPLGSIYIPPTVTVGQEFVFSNGDLLAHYQVMSLSGNIPLWTYEIYFDGVLGRSGSNVNIARDATHYFGLHYRPDTGQVTIWESTSSYPLANPSRPYIGTVSSDTSSLSWTSGNIDTDTGDGLWMVNIPASAFAEITDVQEGYNTDSSIKAAILDALNTFASTSGWLDTPYFGAEPLIPPVPTPTPYPSDSLGAIPYDTWMSDYGTDVTDTLGLIDHDIQDVNDTIGLVGEDIVDVIDTYGQSAVEAIENQTDVIDTYGQSAVDSLDNIDQGINAPLTGIKAKLDSLIDSLADVAENILEAVKQETLGDINKIESLFASIITRLRNAMSIWHYVVEWLGSIGTVFSWVFGAASGTSYFIVLPIYACIAGGIVLGVYRRFGR